MKISKKTISILDNFAKINQGIVFEGGQTLKSMAVMRNIIAEAEVDEDFPEFAIYNLPEFLSVLGIFKEPLLDFKDRQVVVSDAGGTGRVKYFFSDPSVIVTPKKAIKEPDYEINFTVESSVFADVIKGTSILRLPDIVLVKDETGDVSFGAKDLKNPACNSFLVGVNLDNVVNETFEMAFRAESINKILPGSYKVSVSSKRLSKWVSLDTNLTYFISLETTTKFG